MHPVINKLWLPWRPRLIFERQDGVGKHKHYHEVLEPCLMQNSGFYQGKFGFIIFKQDIKQAFLTNAENKYWHEKFPLVVILFEPLHMFVFYFARKTIIYYRNVHNFSFFSLNDPLNASIVFYGCSSMSVFTNLTWSFM